MIGEYYVVTQENGEQYVYVIPTVYNKISEDNPYTPKNGNVIHMYAQFEGTPRGTTAVDALKAKQAAEESGAVVNPWYESWACNMHYFEDVTDKTKDDLVEVIYYEGTR